MHRVYNALLDLFRANLSVDRELLDGFRWNIVINNRSLQMSISIEISLERRTGTIVRDADMKTSYYLDSIDIPNLDRNLSRKETWSFPPKTENRLWQMEME